MKLSELAKEWPFRINDWPPFPDLRKWTPDTVHPLRFKFWELEDYRVTLVSGGTIWLGKR